METWGTPPEVRRACTCFYRLVRSLPAAEQLVFNLRYVEAMEIAQIAHVTRTSLSTTKRRLGKAEERFGRLAKNEPDIEPWLTRGNRWAP